MFTPTYFIGLDVDIVAENFAAAIGTTPWRLLTGPTTFANSLEGFQELLIWLRTHHCTPKQTVLCMETTGIYGEPLAYFLAAQGYRIAVEPSLKVKRAFPAQGYKNGRLSPSIAEYAYHFLDQLRFWKPSPEVLGQIKTLLTTGGHLSQLQTVPSARKAQLRALDAEIRRLVTLQPSVTDDWPCF